MSDNTYSTETIAKLLDLTPRRVQQLAKEGYIPKTARGQYELVGAVQGYIRYLRACANSESVKDLETERSRLTKAKADVAELEAAARRGDLAEVDRVVQEVADEYAKVRAKLLDLPTELAPRMAQVDDANEAREILAEGITKTLEELTHDGGDEG